MTFGTETGEKVCQGKEQMIIDAKQNSVGIYRPIFMELLHEIHLEIRRGVRLFYPEHHGVPFPYKNYFAVACCVLTISNFQKKNRFLLKLYGKDLTMKTIIAIILWFILLSLCWPLAVGLIFLLPLIWLILLPFQILGFTLGVIFTFIGAIFMLPFKVLS